MPLINCPECASEISDTALKCPKCGIQLRKPQRGVFGKIVKWSFIGFNVLMAIWLIGGLGSAGQEMQGLSGAERAGAAVGTGIGAMLILTVWAIGDMILGLFVLLTRPKA